MSLPTAQPTQGINCSEDAHIRIPHPPNPWILRCGPRRKQARDGPTPVRPLHIPGLWSNQQRHCHPENTRLGTPNGTPHENSHHHSILNSSWSCWHPGIGPHHTGTCKQKERQCPVPHTIHADFGIPARNLPRRHAPNEATEAESIDTFKERLSQLRVRCWDHSSTLLISTSVHICTCSLELSTHSGTRTQYAIPS